MNKRPKNTNAITTSRGKEFKPKKEFDWPLDMPFEKAKELYIDYASIKKKVSPVFCLNGHLIRPNEKLRDLGYNPKTDKILLFIS